MADPNARLWDALGLTEPSRDPNALPIPPIPPEQPANQRLFQAMGMPAEAPPEPAPNPETQSLPRAAYRAIGNIPSSAANFAVGLAQPFLHPVDTATAIGNLGKGVYSKGEGLFVNQDPEKKARDEATLNAVGTMYGDRYGSWSKIKETLATDPVGLLADASTVLSGGALAAGRVLPTAGKALSIASQATDPINLALQAARVPAAAAAWSGSKLLAPARSGDASNLMTAYRAGQTKEPVFYQNLTGQVPHNDIVNRIDQIISDKKLARQDQYRTNKDVWGSDPARLSFDTIDNTISTLRDDLTQSGRLPPKNQAAYEALDLLENKINEYRKTDPSLQNAIMFDHLKQNIYNMMSQMRRMDPTTELAGTSVYNAVKNTIAEQAPNYVKAMGEYGEASDKLKDLAYLFGTSNMSDAQRLSRIMNARTGLRKTLLDELAGQHPEIKNALAGAALAHSTPGLGAQLLNTGTALNSLASGNVIPQMLTSAATSPGVLGRTFYGAGALQRRARSTERPAMPILNLGSDIEEADRMGRATGGKVDGIEPLVGRLMILAEKAKKATAQHTKPLLGVDDNTIAHALKTADHAI